MAIVDEGHPYYFDHPLDHVPGILLLEAALQLTEVALADLGQASHQPCSLGVRFRRYTEKQAPIQLTCQRDGAQHFIVRIEQGGQCVCEVEVGTTEAPQRTRRHRCRPAPPSCLIRSGCTRLAPTTGLVHRP